MEEVLYKQYDYFIKILGGKFINITHLFKQCKKNAKRFIKNRNFLDWVNYLEEDISKVVLEDKDNIYVDIMLIDKIIEYVQADVKKALIQWTKKNLYYVKKELDNDEKMVNEVINYDVSHFTIKSELTYLLFYPLKKQWGYDMENKDNVLIMAGKAFSKYLDEKKINYEKKMTYDKKNRVKMYSIDLLCIFRKWFLSYFVNRKLLPYVYDNFDTNAINVITTHLYYLDDGIEAELKKNKDFCLLPF